MIGVVTTSYPRHRGDFAGSFVRGHVEALRQLGHRVEVVSAGDVGGSPLFEHGGAPDRIENAPLRSIVDGVTFTARLVAEVRRRATAWDSIVAHWLVPSAIAALGANKPLIAIAHGGDVHTLRRFRLLGPTLRALRARAARIVFVSEQLRDLAREAVPDLDAVVQPMGIDVERFARIVRSPTDPPTVVVAARLVPIKGVDVAIDAFARIATPARLVIAGDGPEREMLARRAQGCRRVELVGQLDADELDRLLGRASLVVIPSRVTATRRTEGAPTIAFEALAAGVPIVASAVGGLALLDSRDGHVDLVAPDRPEALAAAIDRALGRAGSLDPADLRRQVADLDWRHVAPRLVRSE